MNTDTFGFEFCLVILMFCCMVFLLNILKATLGYLKSELIYSRSNEKMLNFVPFIKLIAALHDSFSSGVTMIAVKTSQSLT